MDVFVSSVVILSTWPTMLLIAVYIRQKSSSSAIFKQIRIAKNRRNHDSLNSRYYVEPRSGELLKERRNHKDVFWASSSERRKFDQIKLYYLYPKDGKIKPERRKTDLFGRPFVFDKFRTMYKNARKQFPELYEYKYDKKEIKQLKFKKNIDPRVPEWARWLRKSSLDELPNFVNVFLGDMSLVGPRPEIPEMTKYYSVRQRNKFAVKPGITGLAQIKGRGNLSFQESLKYDLEYVENQSLLLDMKIIAKTIIDTVKGNGAF
ncbi:MAG: sugar transferase [Desulfobacteraceae bacterium]|nr:sugar transferase [Desulfobacteraceae bacterium]